MTFVCEHACLNIPPQDARLGAETDDEAEEHDALPGAATHDEGLDVKDNIATALSMRVLTHYV